MAILKIQLFGGTRVEDMQGSVDLEGDFPRGPFAFLGSNPGKVFQRDYLAEQLWPEADPDHARGALNTALWRLRRVAPLADRITSPSRHTICFAEGQASWVDVIAFERKVNRGQALIDAAPSIALRLLEQALGLYSHHAYCDIQQEWAVVERTRLENLWLDAMFGASRAALALGHFAKAESYAARLVEYENFREEAHRLRIIAVLRQGDRYRALMLYEDLCRFLMSEIGELPVFEMPDLEKQRPCENRLAGDKLKALRGLVSEFSGSLARFEQGLSRP